jgi:hypothetical protein
MCTSVTQMECQRSASVTAKWKFKLDAGMSIKLKDFLRCFSLIFVRFSQMQKKTDKLKVCRSVHHHTIQINKQLDTKISPVYYLTFMWGSTCFGRPHSHHQELNDCSGSPWFYLRIVVTVVLCSWSGRPARPRPTALLPPSSNSKTRGCYCSCWAHDDGHEDARNMLSRT